MVAIAVVVAALARSTWRTVRSVGSIAGNNLFAIVLLMMAEEPRDRPSSTAVFYLFVGLLYAIPIAADVTRRIPAVRLRLWPLGALQRTAIYAINLVMNPTFVIAVGFAAISRHAAVGLGLLGAGAVAPLVVLLTSFGRRRIGLRTPLRFVLRFPGRLGGLVQHHQRELLQMLDVYLALILVAGAVVYVMRVEQVPDRLRVVVGHLAVLLMSTCAQSNLALDAHGATARIRLLPLRGRDALLARDLAWFSLVIVLILPWAFVPCASAALIACALGHLGVRHPVLPQRRWQFASGLLVPMGVFQILGTIVAGSTVYRFGWPAAVLCIAVYVLSLYWAGRQWEADLP